MAEHRMSMRGGGDAKMINIYLRDLRDWEGNYNDLAALNALYF